MADLELTIQLKDNENNLLYPVTRWQDIKDKPDDTMVDLTLNGSSVVEDGIAVLTTSNGIKSNGSDLCLTLTNVTNTYTPKTQTLTEQANMYMPIIDINNDHVTKVGLNDLDYTKMRVANSDSALSTINTNDFLFVKINE